MALTPTQAREVRSIASATVRSLTRVFATREQLNAVEIDAGSVTSVNGQAGAVSIDADDISTTGTTNKFATAAQLSALSASPPVLTYTGSAWPSASAYTSSQVVIWVQPVVGGPAPATGGRPGRAPGDLVFMAQA